MSDYGPEHPFCHWPKRNQPEPYRPETWSFYHGGGVPYKQVGPPLPAGTRGVVRKLGGSRKARQGGSL